MTQDVVMQKLTEVFRAQFKRPELTLTPITVASDVQGWDSLAHIRLILNIEKAFGVKFKTSEIASFQNVGDLVALMERKLAALA